MGPQRPRKALLLSVAMLTLGAQLAGCGSPGGETSSSTARETAQESTRKSATTTTEKQARPKPSREVHKGSWAPLKRAAGARADRLLLPQGPAPDRVLIRDLEVGEGPVVRRGDWVTIAYKGFNYVTGQQTLEQWGDAAFSWTYGIGELFYGLEPGLEHMRVGGVRELIAPSRLTHDSGAMVLYVSLRKAEKQD